MLNSVHTIVLIAACWLLFAIALAVIGAPLCQAVVAIRDYRQRRAFRKVTDAELDTEFRRLLEQEAGR